jgi:Protein of unknown function (DUF3237)
MSSDVAAGTVGTMYLFDLVAQLEQPRLDLGQGPLGRRFFDRVRTGTFDGPRLRGEVLSGSADPLLRRGDGVSVINARAVLRTDDDALILMTYEGRVVLPADVLADIADPARWHEVDPSRYSIRIAPLFETGDPRYSWLNSVVAVGHGYFAEHGAIGYRVSQLL